MSRHDANVRKVPETEGTKPAGDFPSPTSRESVPFEEDGVEATGGVRGAHSHSPNRQGDVELDRGVGREHLVSTSQGARPEDEEDAASPDDPDAVTRG